MLFQWSDAMLVGVEEIDSQHKVLIDKFALFLEQYMKLGGNDETRAMVTFLGEYVVDHFANEERLMADSYYPEAEEHLSEHQYFIIQLRAIKAAVGDVGPVDAKRTALVIKTLLEWFIGHIKQTDRRLGSFLSAKQGAPQPKQNAAESEP